MKRILPQWSELLKAEFQKPYFEKIKQSYILAKNSGAVIYPRGSLTFRALSEVLPDDLKVVILGQDPYHGSEIVNNREIPQAMGLCFSVPVGLKIPPSLRNIYKELQDNVGFIPPTHGDISAWSNQGVMLLNSILSVEAHKPGSHAHFGWEIFTDSVISTISANLDGIVFMLWGNFARKKAVLIDRSKHFVIQAPHPSPLARGFLGSGVFAKANEALIKLGKSPIDWSL